MRYTLLFPFLSPSSNSVGVRYYALPHSSFPFNPQFLISNSHNQISFSIVRSIAFFSKATHTIRCCVDEMERGGSGAMNGGLDQQEGFDDVSSTSGVKEMTTSRVAFAGARDNFGEEAISSGNGHVHRFERCLSVDDVLNPTKLLVDGSSDVKSDQKEEFNDATSTHRVLEHCNTAPVHTDKEMLGEDHGVTFFKFKNEKKVAPKYDLKLDKLSDSEKKKILVDLVKIQHDGTVEVDVAKSTPVASELLELDAGGAARCERKDITRELSKVVPRLRIAILVVGTRGDVQPFLAIAKRLQEFGHYVRLATHVNFRTFVKSAGIDFYPLGGDPRILAGYMARNKGFLPSAPGEISLQRKQLKAIIDSLLPACTDPDLDTGAPFKAQAIIANPPSYGHTHVAEALGVPLHIFFTMPWTPTHEFPHPLARVSQVAGFRLSYLIVDLVIWWGIRTFINDFRKRKLNLPPIAYFSTYHGSISHLPTGYMWSPHLVPKPSDWGDLVDVLGFCFLNLGAKYHPKEQFTEWIQGGTMPVYIGFGSMPLEDAKKIADIILEALKDTGQRGIIDRGWGDLGISLEVSESIYLLEECPHDWLFPQCAAVVHHGGAGTTATGLRAGCPTTIVPFFGDQFFWGARIHQVGVGPAPIPIAELNVESLSNAIRFMLEPEVKEKATQLAKLIENEDGVAAAVDAFHRHLPQELPTPAADTEEEDPPYPFDWLFKLVEKWCCLPCT